MPDTPLQQLSARRQSVWIDFLSRPFVEDGDLEGLVREGIVGVTSNPTIFQKAIAETDLYDDSIRRLAGRGLSGAALFEALEVEDVRAAAPIARQARVPIIAYSNDESVAGNGVYIMGFTPDQSIGRVVMISTISS